MSYHEIITDTCYVEYSIYINRCLFVHFFSIKESYRGKGHSYKVFDGLKSYDLPIVLECWPTLIKFYEKLGFSKECDTRDGYAEMVYNPKQPREIL